MSHIPGIPNMPQSSSCARGLRLDGCGGIWVGVGMRGVWRDRESHLRPGGAAVGGEGGSADSVIWGYLGEWTPKVVRGHDNLLEVVS